MAERNRCIFCQQEMATDADWETYALNEDDEVDTPGSPYAYLSELCWEQEGEDCLALLAESGRPADLAAALGALIAAEQQRDELLEAVKRVRRPSLPAHIDGLADLYKLAEQIEGEQ